MSRQARGRSHPRKTEWEPETGLSRHDGKMRSIALFREPCKRCGGIPKARSVQVVHPAFGKVWRWYLCGPCLELLESGGLLGELGVI